MKTICIIIFLTLSVITGKSQEVIKTSKHELSIGLNYNRSKFSNYGGKGFGDMFITDFTDEYNNLLRINRKKTFFNGLGIQLQYNRLFNKYLYISSSINFNSYIASKYYHYNSDFSVNKNLYDVESASAFFIDQGIGFIPLSNNKIELRTGFGVGLGYVSIEEIVNPDYFFFDEEMTLLAFKGFSKRNQSSFMIGGFVESALNFKIIPDKMSLGIKYKFFIAGTNLVNSGQSSPYLVHNLGLNILVKL